MSPTEMQDMNNHAVEAPKETAAVFGSQPALPQPMNPERPHPESQDDVHMRGGQRSEACPGRFCFIVPCPIPCDFCIF